MQLISVLVGTEISAPISSISILVLGESCLRICCTCITSSCMNRKMSRKSGVDTATHKEGIRVGEEQRIVIRIGPVGTRGILVEGDVVDGNVGHVIACVEEVSIPVPLSVAGERHADKLHARHNLLHCGYHSVVDRRIILQCTFCIMSGRSCSIECTCGVI